MSILLYNGTVKGEEDYEWLLIRGNRIAEMGCGNPPAAARKVDLKGGYVFPGFCDSHAHLEILATLHGYLDLSGKKRDEVLKLVKEECRKRKLVIGRGWDESFWERREYLTREELDEVCENPAILIREDGHVGVVNTAFLKKYGISGEDGLLREDALSKALKKLNFKKTLDFDYAQKYALGRGVTCVHDFAGEDTLRRYMEMHRKGTLKIRIFASFYRSTYTAVKKMGLHTGFGDSWLKIGALKLFADGSIGAKTAATTYADGTSVAPILTDTKLRRIVRDANSRGIRVMTHAIGDLAIDEVLKAYRDSEGNRIEHLELVREDQLSLLHRREVSMQPNFLKWNSRGGLYHQKLGEYWLSRNNPYRELLNSGVALLFGSDCMPMDPLFGIHHAVNSEYPKQRISVDDALHAYTAGAKYMNERLGEIRRDYLADLVVLDRDPYAHAERMREIKVKMTFVDGKLMHISE